MWRQYGILKVYIAAGLKLVLSSWYPASILNLKASNLAVAASILKEVLSWKICNRLHETRETLYKQNPNCQSGGLFLMSTQCYRLRVNHSQHVFPKMPLQRMPIALQVRNYWLSMSKTTLSIASPMWFIRLVYLQNFSMYTASFYNLKYLRFRAD